MRLRNAMLLMVHAGFREDKLGQLEKNTFELDPIEIKNVKVISTFVGGKDKFVK